MKKLLLFMIIPFTVLGAEVVGVEDAFRSITVVSEQLNLGAVSNGIRDIVIKIFDFIWGTILFADTQHISQAFPVLEIIFLFLGFLLCLCPKVIINFLHKSWQKIDPNTKKTKPLRYLGTATAVYVVMFLLCNFFLNTDIVNLAMRFMFVMSYIVYVWSYCMGFLGERRVHYRTEKYAFIVIMSSSYTAITLEFLMATSLIFSLYVHMGILTDLFGSYFLITALFNGFLSVAFILSMILVGTHYKRPVSSALNILMCMAWYVSWVFHHFSLITARTLGEIFVAMAIIFSASFFPVVTNVAKKLTKLAQKNFIATKTDKIISIESTIFCCIYTLFLGGLFIAFLYIIEDLKNLNMVISFMRQAFFSLITVLLVLFIAYYIGRFVDGLIDAIIQQRASYVIRKSGYQFVTLLALLKELVPIVLWVFSFLIVLVQFGVDGDHIMATLGVSVAILVFVGRVSITDFLNGLSWILKDIIAVGDIVRINQSFAGIIERLTLRTLSVRDESGVVHSINYSSITTISSSADKFVFAMLNITVPHNADIPKALEVMQEVGDTIKIDFGDDVHESFEVLGVHEITLSGALLRGRIKVNPKMRTKLQRAMNLRIKEFFNKNNIAVAVQAHVVHLEKNSI